MTIKNKEITHTKSIPIKCAAKAQLNENGVAQLTFQGYSGDKVNLSDYGFDAPVVYDIDSMVINKKIPILYNHNEAIGHTTNIRKVENGSAVRGKGLASLPGETTTKVVEGAKNGFPWQGSMGLSLDDFEKNITYISKGTVNVNNRSFTGPVYIVYNTELGEMTVTPFGRDSDTSFEVLNADMRMKIKNATPPPDGKKDRPDPKVPSEGDGAQDTKDTKNSKEVDNEEVEDEEEEEEEEEEEVKNSKKPPIQNKKGKKQKVDNTEGGQSRAGRPKIDPTTKMWLELSKKYPGKEDKIVDLIEKDWSQEHIENSLKLEALDDQLPTPPSPGKKIKNGDLLSARLCLSLSQNPNFIEKKFGKEITNKAYDAGEFSLIEMIMTFANASGGRFNGHSDVDSMCKFLKNTAYSTVDFPGFFQSVVTTVKEARWEALVPWATTMCREGSNQNFKPHERVRVTGGDVWKAVAADGKIDLWAVGAMERYLTKLETYGTLFTFTRPDVINDDMGVIQDMIDMMIEGAMIIPDIQLGKLMLSKLNSASGFWQEDVNSFYETAFTEANLEEKYNAIRQRSESKSSFSWNMMISDTWNIIHGVSLEKAIWRLIKQDKIIADSTVTGPLGDQNYWLGKLNNKLFPQISNTSVFNNASKFVGENTWILWPKNPRFAPYEITYLRGQKRPTTESVDLPAEFLGFGVRGYWDVKVNEREPEAIMRMTSETAPA